MPSFSDEHSDEEALAFRGTYAARIQRAIDDRRKNWTTALPRYINTCDSSKSAWEHPKASRKTAAFSSVPYLMVQRGVAATESTKGTTTLTAANAEEQRVRLERMAPVAHLLALLHLHLLNLSGCRWEGLLLRQRCSLLHLQLLLHQLLLLEATCLGYRHKKKGEGQG